MDVMEIAVLGTTIGPIRIAVDGGAVTSVKFTTDPDGPRSDPLGAVDALAAYFSGAMGALDELPVRPSGTEFQQRVWRALRVVPAGETVSYADLAREIGNTGAVRAVGHANATNPIGIIIPCHRVIRSDGSLGGYGGGLDRKQWLLAHEARAVRRSVK
jgi:methylated-DNA-[protein]-cysteine S-methyltransferase